MRYFNNPKWSKRMFPEAIWDFSFHNDRAIYLTFDDGPNPKVTPFVLEILKKHNAQATFFCLGENVQKYPDLYQKIIADGHAIGNHGMYHLNGWKTNSKIYIKNIEDASQFIDSKLFRPPYGKISSAQKKWLLQENYKIIMWSVMAYDFDPKLSSVKRISKMKKLTSTGAIFVFHDNPKSFENLTTDLPELMDYWKGQQFSFSKIY
jgi:peptidoglycan-N-acetylglucosamine deacetylase